jgi:2-dehydropantoate 2-reductase
MRVLVVGAGAVGSWVGGWLAAGGAQVVCAEPGTRREEIERRGLVLVSGNSVVTVPAAVVGSAAEALAGPPFDLVLVTVKSPHTSAVARELARAGGASRVASFQNGVGNDEALVGALPNADVVTAVLTTGLQLPGDGAVAGSTKGGVGLASWTPGARVDDVEGVLSAAGVAVRTYADARSLRWSKLLLNLLGSATCAALSWPPERVFADPRLVDLERRAWLEALAVMRASGLVPLDLPGYPVRRYAAASRLLPSRVLHLLLGSRLAGGRGDRLPGVAADLAAGRAATENTVLTLAVARAGERHAVSVPVSRALGELVEAIAAGRVPRDRFAGKPDALVAHVLSGAAP